MAGRFKEAHEVRPSDRGRHGVDERMIVQRFVAQHGLVEHDLDAARDVVDRGEGRDRPRRDPQRFAQEVRRAEREAAGAEPVVQRFQVDRCVFQRDDEQERAALVLEEEIFRVPSGDLPAQATGFLDGEQTADG